MTPVPYLKSGSSPRMRGAPAKSSPPILILRIIPADAGSTGLVESLKLVNEDHPRGCGEHAAELTASALNEGSSPRMRGALSEALLECQEDRIIPADAGSTVADMQGTDTSKDHPRGCGEHRHQKLCLLMVMGSSPRMRGAPWRELDDVIALGIIPADAGSTMGKVSNTMAGRDHPRGCGEHSGKR